MFDPSLLDLVAQESVVIDETVVAEYIEDTKTTWSKGGYWLGGQVKMMPTDKITDELFARVKQLYVEKSDYGPANSWEMASIWRAQRQFTEIEAVVKRYREVMRQRVLAELAKTPLPTDVHGIIISHLMPK
jgi:hypothetical protein